MANILLIHPRRNYRTIEFSLSLGSIGGALKQNGHHVAYSLLYLPWNRHWEFGDIADHTDVVGITVCSADYEFAVATAKSIKRISPRIPVIAGGAHATFDPSSLLLNGFDICVRGEGEHAIVEVVGKLLQSKKQTELLGTIKGISFVLPDGRITHNENRDIVLDLDQLPFPDWYQDDYRRILQQFNIPSSDIINQVFPDSRLSPVPIESSRGCPFNCIFCTASKMKGKKWRSKSADRVFAEYRQFRDFYATVMGNRNDFPRTIVRFIDENFCLNKKRVYEICGKLDSLSKNVRPYWSMMAHASKLRDKEFLVRMQKSGCVRIFIGAECGYSKGLRRIKKGQTLDMIDSAVSSILESNIPILILSWIIGFPWERKCDALRTMITALRYAQRNPNVIKTAIYTLTPLAGAEITLSVGDSLKGRMSDPERYDSFGFRHPYMSDKELFELQTVAGHLIYLFNDLCFLLSKKRNSYEHLFDEVFKLSHSIRNIENDRMGRLLRDIYGFYSRNIFNEKYISRNMGSKISSWLDMLEEECEGCSSIPVSQQREKSSFPRADRCSPSKHC